MSVVLIFPPVVDPRAPHLAIPSLAGYLRQNGVEVSVRDLNLEGLDWIVREAYLETAAAAVDRRLAIEMLSEKERSHLLDIVAHAPFVAKAAAHALLELRTAESFFDPNRHHQARNTLRYATALAAAANGHVRYGISSAQYDVRDVDASRLTDLTTATERVELNIFHDLWTETILPDLERQRPDLVGISILNGQQIIPGLMLARLLKQRAFTVVLGGTVFSKFGTELQARPQFFELFCNGVIMYEGERAMLELHRAIRTGRNLAEVPNLISVRGGRVIVGPTHVEDVNSLPTPDFEGLPLAKYLTPFPVLPLLTGKGCYFNQCKFCDIPSINVVSRKPYRMRRPELIAADIETLATRHGVRHFVITDEALSPRLLLALADSLERRPAARACRPRFVGYARLERGFSPELCRRLYDMGLRKLFFGLESGCQETLDHMKKDIRVDTSIDVLRNCKDAGIAYHVFSMIGFPQEQETSARQTAQYFLDNRDLFVDAKNSFDVHRFGLDLRTTYFDQAERYGIEVDREQLARSDFPISVPRWHNKLGLDGEHVDRLLAEFDAVLYRGFAGARCYPDNYWPAFEEYAVLYSDRYPDQFPYRSCLPPSGSPQKFRLGWAHGVRLGEVVEGRRCISSVGGSTEVGSFALDVLQLLPEEALTVDELLARLISRIPHEEQDRDDLSSELRALFDELIKTKVMWLHLADVPNTAFPAPMRPHNARASGGLRLSRATQLEMIYKDDTPFGSLLGGKLERNVRQLFEPLLRRARAEGHLSAIAHGPELLQDCIKSPAFRQIMESVSCSGWIIKPEILYPDPARTVPVGIKFTSSRTGSATTIALESSDLPIVADLIRQLESPAGMKPSAMPGWAAPIAQLVESGLVETAEADAHEVTMEACDLAFVGHNTVVVNAGAVRIMVDPFFLPSTPSSEGYSPLRPSDLGKIDAVLITHSHPDHFDLTSLMRLGRDTLIMVPDVPRESILSIDMTRRLNELGMSNVISLRWGERRNLSDVEISVLPFYGEQPSSGAILHPEVRNQGSLYVIRGPRVTAALVADAGTDNLGSVAEVARDWRHANGPVDVLFAGYRGWFTYPAQLVFSSVPQYLLFVPPTEWGIRQKLMNDATDAVDLAEAFGTTTLVPYGAGGAPWYWERGLGPRLDGATQRAANCTDDEDVSFDPMPDRVDEAARQRLWIPRHGWLGSRAQVLHMRPGDGIVDLRDKTRIVTKSGCAWPWKRSHAPTVSSGSLGLA